MRKAILPYGRIGLVLLGSLAFRLTPLRPPNLEPVLATALPIGRRYGAVSGFLFAAISMGLYDLITGSIGLWTLVTAVTYGCIGAASALLKRGRHNFAHTLGFGLVATIAYDLITGVCMGALFFHVPWREAFLGQVPFTVNHLIGNGILIATLTPLLETWLASGDRSLVFRRVAARLSDG